MNVLHLIEAGSPQANATTLALLASTLQGSVDARHRVLLLGGEAMQALAVDVGVPAASLRTQGVPFGWSMLAWTTVRQRCQELWQGTGSDQRVIHAWSLGAAIFAATAFPRVPRLLTLTQEPSPAAIGWLRVLCSEAPGRTVLLPISNTIRRAMIMRGLAEAAAHVLRPAIDLAKVAPASVRSEFRRAWGVDDQTKVIAMLSDPPGRADAVEALLAMLLADQMLSNGKGSLRLLMHPRQHHGSDALAMLRKHGSGDVAILESALDQPWKVLPACDIALNLAAGGGGLSLLWAMASGVPILGDADYAISEIVEDRHSALLVRPGVTRQLAQKMVTLATDARLAWQLRDAARNEAYSFFSRRLYSQNLERVYQQVLAAQAVDIPPLPVTAGVRFHGRG